MQDETGISINLTTGNAVVVTETEQAAKLYNDCRLAAISIFNQDLIIPEFIACKYSYLTDTAIGSKIVTIPSFIYGDIDITYWLCIPISLLRITSLDLPYSIDYHDTYVIRPLQ